MLELEIVTAYFVLLLCNRLSRASQNIRIVFHMKRLIIPAGSTVVIGFDISKCLIFCRRTMCHHRLLMNR